jgi:hypothetical protein
LAAIAFLAPRTAASAGSDAAAYPIDDFEGSAALRSWRFYSAPESPAAGGLALGPGHRGHGAVLTYRLPCGGCGAYAAASWQPASPLPKKHDPALSLWIRFSPEVEVFIVAKDTSGRTSRFPIRPTIEHPKAGDWQYAVVPLSASRTGDAAGDDGGGIKGRLVETGILVQSRVRAAIEGSVSFDEVKLRESSEIFHLDAAAEVQPPLPDSVDLSPRLGVNVHLLQDNPALDAAHAAGFSFVRMDMLWANVERGGRYRFFAYDSLLRALDARGMGALWILDYGHPDHGGDTPRAPEDRAAFARFAAAAATHFKGRNVRFEIWNEPNTSHFWPPSPNALEYADLLREAVAAIRKADPSAKVCSGGLSRMDGDFLSRSVNPSLAAGLTAIGIHPYPRSGPESIVPDLSLLRAWVASALAERLEIWDTEWGYSSADALKGEPSNGHAGAGLRRQAVLAVREILTVWTAGLPLAVWYDLRDDGPDRLNPEHNYGLLDSDGNEKPALKAIRNLMGAVNGRKYAGMMQEAPTGLHAMRLDGSADAILIVWADRPGRRAVEYSKRALISATDVMGQPIKSKSGPSGEARVEIDDAAGPIYLRWSATVPLKSVAQAVKPAEARVLSAFLLRKRAK